MGKSPKIAAAICYRRDGDRIQILLVRTKGGKHWTFPKGHIEFERGEAPWQAAKRESGEEAGVDGTIEKEPFTHYAYRKGKKPKASVVAAFLMKVTSEREPDEPFRDPQWYTPEAAAHRLAEGRDETRFIAEHQRVIGEALVAIRKTKGSGRND